MPLTAHLAPQAFLLSCILVLMLARDEAPLARRQTQAKKNHCTGADSDRERQEVEEQSDLA